MAKDISIMYSINVFFEKKFQVDDDFVLSKDIKLAEAFSEIVKRLPEENQMDLDDTNCNCSSDYYDQNPYELDSIEIRNLENPLLESQFIGK